jgi:hypothetical protein
MYIAVWVAALVAIFSTPLSRWPNLAISNTTYYTQTLAVATPSSQASQKTGKLHSRANTLSLSFKTVAHQAD